MRTPSQTSIERGMIEGEIRSLNKRMWRVEFLVVLAIASPHSQQLLQSIPTIATALFQKVEGLF